MKEWLEVARGCGCSEPSECNLFLKDGDLGSLDLDSLGRVSLPLVASDTDGCRR